MTRFGTCADWGLMKYETPRSTISHPTATEVMFSLHLGGSCREPSREPILPWRAVFNGPAVRTAQPDQELLNQKIRDRRARGPEDFGNPCGRSTGTFTIRFAEQYPQRFQVVLLGRYQA